MTSNSGSSIRNTSWRNWDRRSMRPDRSSISSKDHAGKLGEYLNEPENAKRLFDASFAGEAEAPTRSRLLSRLLDRLEQHEILYHILASYEIRPIAADYCPPVHLQKPRKRLVSKGETNQGGQGDT